jgi:hypothetical protein
LSHILNKRKRAVNNMLRLKLADAEILLIYQINIFKQK